jgi:uncharacterized protein (DUF1330 family)
VDSLSAYFVLQIEWTDDAARQEYIEGISGMIQRHGGKYIVSSTNFQVVEGQWNPGRLVILEFPDVPALRGWYDSDEYRSFLALRLRGSRSNAVITDGL